MNICECCQQKNWTSNTLNSYRGKKYLLCKSCLENLKARSLLPREWYNLIVIHGPNAEYINSRYYYTNGLSIYPKIIREIGEDDQLPVLINVKNNFLQLMEYCLFPFSQESLKEKLSVLHDLAVKESKIDEIIKNEDVLTLILEINPFFISELLKENECLQWINSHWEHNQKLSQAALVKTSLAHMPVDDVLNLVNDKIINQRWDPSILRYFPSAVAIGWIEKNAQLSENKLWDFIASLNITWSIIEKWVSAGRPLSILALKTLSAISNSPNPDVKLYEPVSIQHMSSVLEAYQKKDTVPNVKSIVDYCIKSNWVKIIKNESRNNFASIENKNYADPFIGKLKQISNVSSYHIKTFKKTLKTDKFITKFGGQPDWLTIPEWPLSKSENIPMKFIAQIHIDKEIFPDSAAKMAYIFMTDCKEVDETWEYYGGENAIILQPGNNEFIKFQNHPTGESISKDSYIVETKLINEPNYIPQDALSTILSKKEEKEYLKGIDGNKIGGIPYFLQTEDYPGGKNKWYLLLQLTLPPAKFNINFGDGGSGYVFLSEDGKRAVLTWQCF